MTQFKSPCDGCMFALWDITHDAKGRMNGFADFGTCEHPLAIKARQPLPMVLYRYTQRQDPISRYSFFEVTRCETRKEEDTE